MERRINVDDKLPELQGKGRGGGGGGVELVHPEFSLFCKEEVKFTIQSNVEVCFVEKS